MGIYKRKEIESEHRQITLKADELNKLINVRRNVQQKERIATIRLLFEKFKNMANNKDIKNAIHLNLNLLGIAISKHFDGYISF